MNLPAVDEKKNDNADKKRLATRVRFTAIATLVIAVVMLGAGLLLMIVHEHGLMSDFDDNLQSQSESLERDFLAGTLPRIVEPQGSKDLIVQVVYADATVLASTANMENQFALKSPDGDATYRNATLPIDSRRFRLLSRRAGDVVIHTGMPFDHVEDSTDALRTALSFGIPAVTLLLGLLAWFLVGRALRAPVVQS